MSSNESFPFRPVVLPIYTPCSSSEGKMARSLQPFSLTVKVKLPP